MIVQLVVATGNRAGQIIPVLGEKFIIGRAEDCHLRPQSELISRYHCAILVGHKVVVRDLGSKNGVRLNEKKISAEQELHNSDKLTVGPLEFYLYIDSDADAVGELSSSNSAVANGWYKSNDGGESELGPSDPTVLLHHLQLLNQEANAESSVFNTNPIKKLL